MPRQYESLSVIFDPGLLPTTLLIPDDGPDNMREGRATSFKLQNPKIITKGKTD